MKKTTIETLGKENAFDLIGKEWMLVTANNSGKFNTMTAENFIDKAILEHWYNDKPSGGLHDIYVVEIEEVYTK